MDISFTINPLGLEGLGATLISLIRNCSKPNDLRLWFFCSNCKASHRRHISLLLETEGFSGTLKFVDFDARSEFGHLRSLHGDWSSYGRLLIPDYVQSDTVLYLDADLIVSVDVCKLETFDFGDHFLAAVPGGKVKYALERKFLQETLHLEPDTDYFNAGVLLLNLKLWREEGVQQQWKEIAKQHPEELLAVDQTLLNAICRGRFAHLPVNFNNAWCPGDGAPNNAFESIIHFVGSPKPWDMFGRTLHLGYDTWHRYSTPHWNKKFHKLSWGKVVRTWKIKNSILIKMRRKFTKAGS